MPVHALPTLAPRRPQPRQNFQAYDSEGNVVGVLSVDYDLDEKFAFISGLEVDKVARRQGYGRRLVRQFEDEARKAGIESVLLDAWEEAVPFWEALGYFQDGDVENQEGRLLYGMGKDL